VQFTFCIELSEEMLSALRDAAEGSNTCCQQFVSRAVEDTIAYLVCKPEGTKAA
jgi:hypothetical protein